MKRSKVIIDIKWLISKPLLFRGDFLDKLIGFYAWVAIMLFGFSIYRFIEVVL